MFTNHLWAVAGIAAALFVALAVLVRGLCHAGYSRRMVRRIEECRPPIPQIE